MDDISALKVNKVTTKFIRKHSKSVNIDRPKVSRQQVKITYKARCIIFFR